MLETGAVADGATWLRRWLGEWQDPDVMGCHLTWHLALFQLFDRERVVDELDGVLGYVGRSVSVLSDGASLLWRLHLAGQTDLDWAVLRDVPSLLTSTFSSLHRALVLAGLNDVDGLAALRDEWRSRASVGSPSAATCADVIDALSCFVQGDARAAADLLLSVELSIPTLGGSRAQLEVIDDTLIAALHRSQRSADAYARLEARLKRRPSQRDSHWLALVSAGPLPGSKSQ